MNSKVNEIKEMLEAVHPVNEWVIFPDLTPKQIEILQAISKDYHQKYLDYEPDMDALINYHLLYRKGDKVYPTPKGRVMGLKIQFHYMDKLPPMTYDA